MLIAGCDKTSTSPDPDTDPDPPVEETYDITFAAQELVGFYYGQDYSNGSEYNYYINLSDIGYDEAGYTMDNGHYYTFDIFSDVAPADESHIVIPAGTYTLGASGETAAGTFTVDYSSYFDTTETGGKFYFTSGTIEITVDGDNVTLDAVLEDDAGLSHHVTYSGSGVLESDSAPELPDSIDFEASFCEAEYIPGYGNNGENNFYIYISDIGMSSTEPGGHFYIIDLFTDAEYSAETGLIPDGTYTLGESGETLPGTFTPDYSGYADMAQFLESAFVEGTITISHSGSNQIVEATILDSAGCTHTISFNGVPTIIDYSELMSVEIGRKHTKSMNIRPVAGKIAVRK